jgi:hypothetical protein
MKIALFLDIIGRDETFCVHGFLFQHRHRPKKTAGLIEKETVPFWCCFI